MQLALDKYVADAFKTLAMVLKSQKNNWIRQHFTNSSATYNNLILTNKRISPSWTQNTTAIAELFEQQGEIFYLEIFKGENSNYHKNNFIAIFKRQKLKCYYFKQIIFFRSFFFIFYCSEAS